MRLTALCTLFLGLAGGLVVAYRSADDPNPNPASFTLNKGDRICVIGNTLADRLQHDGWLDTQLHARFPQHDLVIRHLGYSGDEIDLRLRSANFGSPDEWLSGKSPAPQRVPGADENRFELTNTQADVIFAFFGYGESHAGKEGLEAFKKKLDGWVKSTLGKKYNGKTPPRLVLCSPIAHEDHGTPNLPDGKENNERLALYAAAMKEVATANKIAYVDLFNPTLAHYPTAKQKLTINGIHLNEEGNRFISQIIAETLFGKKELPARETLEKIRAAVKDRNWHWFHRYRVTDGYSTYGGRAFLTFAPDKQSNYVVGQRELRILDIMTANRDKAVWAAAKGENYTVKDDNLPEHLEVKTNKPGPLPGGKHLYLDAQKAIEKMKVHPEMQVELFACEKDFPGLFVNPVQMAFDPKGRLWVAVWPTYPHWRPGEPMDDKILILEDTTGDGRADKCTVFADKLHCPTGFEFYNGGVLVAQCPDLWFLKDTTGDGKADLRERVLHGLDSADTHHASNSFVMDPGGAIYFQEGTFHHTQVETPYGKTERCANAGVFRYHPRMQKFEVYVSFGFANPHGHIFDRWGRDIVVDGTGANPYDAALFSGRVEFPTKHARPPQVWTPPSRPCPGMEVISSKHFPESMQGNILVPNVIGFQGIFQIKVEDDGASMKGTRVEDILSSTDPNFRPSDVKIGPDGAIYFIEWHNPIIGHMQHNLRDPSRGREHGRAYRIRMKNKPLGKPVSIAEEPIETLVKLLEEPEDRVRYRARLELTARPTEEVLAAANKWVNGLDPKASNYEHALLEALWLHQSHNVVEPKLLAKVLAAKEPKARAAATRVVGYWKDRLPDALDLLRTRAADEHPRVRLEAVRAASFFTEAEALEVVLIAEEHPSDKFLDFVKAETMKTLQPYVRKAIADGRKITFKTPAGARYFLRTVTTEDLLKMERSQGVYLELLFRPGVRDEFRREAVSGLAKIEKKAELPLLLEAIKTHDADNAADPGVSFDIARMITERTDLAKARESLLALATTARQPLTRQIGYVALIAADGNVEQAWETAVKNVHTLQDLVDAVPMVRDPSARAALYPRLKDLLHGLPKPLGTTGSEKRTTGRYVRIELPGRLRTLTLAEVEVFSGGVNVARKGKATQHSTAHGGNASRAIDGNTSGNYADGSSTHTQEGVTNPWWEVDLGREYPLESVAIYNRTDGALGQRLKNYTLKILDGSRKVVFERAKLPTPEVKAVFAVGTLAPERVLRRAALQALPSIRGKEADMIPDMVKFLSDEQDRPAALKALLAIPPRLWPADQAKPVLDTLMAYIRSVPAAERTSETPLDALQLCDAVAGLLPADEAKTARRTLADIGVRVLRLGTLVEQMIYDRERLVVQAGKPVELVFDNPDTMPHNWVLVQPGSLEEIGDLAEKTAQDATAMKRQYVPNSPKVLVKSALVQPRAGAKISFTAPSKPGVYPYVCTYPGHWRRMNGALYVVEDLEAYQADPEAYLAKSGIKPVDKILEFNRPRKEWTLKELVADVETLSKRNYSSGKQIFTVASCVSCHKFGGEGQEFGPDLTKLDPKWGPKDLLEHTLDPSLKIDDKYKVYRFETKTGKVFTGMILKEADGVVEVIENPLAAAKPLRLKTAGIAVREPSKVSLMPKGLLDRLTKEEILDLMAYVLSGADPKHKVFGEGH
jgi:putative heme-binding domain-containing protein